MNTTNIQSINNKTNPNTTTEIKEMTILRAQYLQTNYLKSWSLPFEASETFTLALRLPITKGCPKNLMFLSFIFYNPLNNKP